MSKENTIESPYVAARREWNERYGSYIARERTWMIVALLSLLAALAAIGGLIHVAERSQFIPYVVQVDQLGRSAAAGVADQVTPLDTRLYQATIARFIENWRTVIADGVAQKKMVFAAYAHLAKTDPAYRMLNEYFPKANPFERAQTETVGIDIESVYKISGDTWEAQWTETARDRRGAVHGIKRYKSAMTLTREAVTRDEKAMLQNPLGLYIKELTWSQVWEGEGK